MSCCQDVVQVDQRAVCTYMVEGNDELSATSWAPESRLSKLTVHDHFLFLANLVHAFNVELIT